MESIRTLLVEDDTDGPSSIQGQLLAAGGSCFAVEQRRTLQGAESRVRAGRLDVVLLDLDLPDASGVDAVVRLHAAAPGVPIVAMTDGDDEERALRALQARAEDCLVKSRTDPAGLKRTLRQALERRRIQAGLDRNVRALERNEARLRNVVATTSDGVVVLSREGAVLFANPSAARLVGRPRAELHGELLGYPFAQQERAQQERREVTVGNERVLEVHIAEGEWDGAPVWIASLFDITVHKRFQADLEQLSAWMKRRNARLERLASIDPLTELLNRRGLEAELLIEVRRKRRTGAPLAAVLVDCDDFKRINETRGHAGGDAVLKELADRLKNSLRPSDHIGRIGGDEFLVLLPDTRFAEAFQVAERLRLSVSDAPLCPSAGPVHVSASLGIELVSDASSSIDEVLVRTEASLQHSKRGGKNRVSTQDGGALRGASDSEDIVRELRRENAFRVLRRPILRLSDASTAGWELVSRGPAGIFEMPRDFFRLALERNIQAQVDLRCLRACVQQAHAGPDRSCYHVSLLPSTLLETPLELLLGLLAPRGAVQQFCLEISEQQFIGAPGLLRDAVCALREAGIRVAIADVGFGRSSLETLVLLEPDLVRIDRDFVRRALCDPGQGRALRRMVGGIQSLGSELVADGIESRADLEVLREFRVTYGQGSLWGQPEVGAARDLPAAPRTRADASGPDVGGTTRTSAHAGPTASATRIPAPIRVDARMGRIERPT